MRKNRAIRIGALLAALVLCISLFSLAVWADDDSDTEATETTVQKTEAKEEESEADSFSLEDLLDADKLKDLLDSDKLKDLLDTEKLKDLMEPDNFMDFVKANRVILIAIGGGIVALIVIAGVSSSLYARKKQREEEIRRKEAEEARIRREEQNRMADALAAKRHRNNANPMPLSKFMLRRSDGAVFPIVPGVNVIGRGEDGVQISFPADEVLISRKHCALEVQNGTLYLTDLGSVNGTFVAGMKLPPNNKVALRNGSSFWLAIPKYTFTVC